MNFYDELKLLVEKINFNDINLSIINNNSKKLVDLYFKLKMIWNSLNFNFEIIKLIDDKEKKKLFDILNDNFLIKHDRIKNFIENNKYTYKLNYSKINFYFFYSELEIKKRDLDIVLKMFKISVCLYKYKYDNINNDKMRNIIWIPIDSNRNYIYDNINKKNLLESHNKFEAFIASGVTWNKNTIITRYEEVIKLLCHELIHNYNLDGSKYYDEHSEIIIEYTNVKQNENNSNHNYDYMYSIYESYTELLSTYLYLIFINLDNEYDAKSIRDNLRTKIILELIYSYNTIANLSALNGYKNWDEFNKCKIFKGDICFYEYYYIKGLMYNNFNFELGLNQNDFKIIYKNIIEMIIETNKNEDQFLKKIFNNYIKQKNFKYIIH